VKPVLVDPAAAVSDIPDGASIMVGGFAGVGVPVLLLRALAQRGVRDLTIIANGTPHRRDPANQAAMVPASMIARAILSFPVGASPQPENPYEQGYERGAIGLEIVPQGTLAERIRAGGAGIPAFYTPTGVGTPFADGKEVREINGRLCVLEHALRADFALIRAHTADRLGNLTYRNAGRNFNPIMAMAADVSIAEVDAVVEPGTLDPEHVVTPGIFVDRIVVAERERVA